MPTDTSQNVSTPTLRRLPVYLHLLRQMHENGIESVSSTIIAEKLKLASIQVRKDLSATGIVGKPKTGYTVIELINTIETFLVWNKNINALLVGVGSLGSALLGYGGFENNGINIIAAFDTDPNKIGSIIRGRKVFSLSEIPKFVEENNIIIGVITVPSEYAQDVCDIMVKSNIIGIWNFTPTALETPENVVVKNQDPTRGLAELTYRLSIIRKEKNNAAEKKATL